MANQDNLPELFEAEPPEAFVEAGDGGAAHHVEPELLGLAPYQWVALAMLVLIGVLLLGAKVHKLIAGGLDGRIAAIREQLAEAKALREEAEALREEYKQKIANAEKDAAAMLDNARAEAASIVERAEKDTAAVIARREQMAADKISAAERQAVEDLRARAAEAATAASANIVAERHDAQADRKLIDDVIAGL